MTSRDRRGDSWLDQEAGPIVRPYALTKGRTQASDGALFGLIDVVVATGLHPFEAFRPGPEHRRIMSLCHIPIPVVDVASEVDLPIGVLRVLLGDLAHEGMLRILAAPRGPVTDLRLLRSVLDGLESL